MTESDLLVLFDIGGVALRLDYGSFYRALEKQTGEAYETIRTDYAPLELKNLRGETNKEQFLHELSTRFKLHADQLRELMKLCWPETIKETLRIKQKLAEAGIPIGLFSNIGDLSLELIAGLHPEIFDLHGSKGPRIYSFEKKGVKPDRPMYEAVNGYQKVILIEDKDKYLRTGIEQFGWFGIFFTEHIDHAEAIRAVEGKEEYRHERLRIANAVEELYTALQAQGIAVSR